MKEPYNIAVRATPKSNSVDDVRALQGDATVLEDAIKIDGDGIIIERWLTKAFPHTMDGGNPKRTQLGCLLGCIQFIYYVTGIVHYLNTPKRLRAYSRVHYYKSGTRENYLSHG